MKQFFIFFISIISLNPSSAKVLQEILPIASSSKGISLTILQEQVHLSASIDNDKALLQWTLNNNAGSNYFELQKSIDGVNFSAAALIFTSEKEGAENYFFKASIAKPKYYRLKIINNNKDISYSNIIILKKESAVKKSD